MQRSESISNLAQAFALAQGEFDNAIRDHSANVRSKKGEDSSYKYNYADLASVLEAVRTPMAKNGMSVVQLPFVDCSTISITTILLHSSGEWIESEKLSMPADANMSGPQALGASITYARRYALACVLGIATEADDDANHASGNEATTGPRNAESQPACPKCGKSVGVISNKYAEGGKFCWPNKGGCGYKWAPGIPAPESGQVDQPGMNSTTVTAGIARIDPSARAAQHSGMFPTDETPRTSTQQAFAPRNQPGASSQSEVDKIGAALQAKMQAEGPLVNGHATAVTAAVANAPYLGKLKAKLKELDFNTIGKAGLAIRWASSGSHTSLKSVEGNEALCQQLVEYFDGMGLTRAQIMEQVSEMDHGQVPA